MPFVLCRVEHREMDGMELGPARVAARAMTPFQAGPIAVLGSFNPTSMRASQHREQALSCFLLGP
jgi:hypothetical protein